MRSHRRREGSWASHGGGAFWRELSVELATSPPNTSLIRYETTDRDLLQSMIFDGRIHLQCRSLDLAGVVLDYIEARIRY